MLSLYQIIIIKQQQNTFTNLLLLYFVDAIRNIELKYLVNLILQATIFYSNRVESSFLVTQISRSGAMKTSEQKDTD